MSTVFFDIDTQIDFVMPAGALYAPGAERILANVAALTRHAAASGIPLISTTDAHAENDPEFRAWPAHCVAGTLGQRKPEATLLERRVVVPAARRAVEAPAAQQWIVEKQALDCFTNPNLEELLARLGCQRCVVYGVVTEYCVRLAALGLLARGFAVEVATDAVCALSSEASRSTLDEIAAAGGTLTTVSAVCR